VKEPDIVVEHRDQLVYLLTEAAEIEHGLMCCYLFSAFSLKRGAEDGLTPDEAAAVARWRRVILDVAVDEMLHLAVVSNLLTAIGAVPHLHRANFPVAPGYHPAGIVVSLAPFDAETLDHFIFLERPEGAEGEAVADGAGFAAPLPYERVASRDRLVPSAQDYATVGHLYRGISDGFGQLAGRMGEGALFIGEPRAQVGPDIFSMTGFAPVTDVASAQRAIGIIVEQGEGSPGHHERSHFNRFCAVRDEHRALLAARPAFAPAHPVAKNPVMRSPPDPRGRVHITDPRATGVLDIANAIYLLALHALSRGFGHADDPPAARRVLFDAAIDLMQTLTPVAELLCRLPAGPAHPGVNAGFTFTVHRSAPNLGDHRAAWVLLAERSRAIAAVAQRAGAAIDPSLATAAARLLDVATRLDGAAPG
jgi:hypothetical protein